MMKCFPASGHPMDALQSSAASLGLFYSRRAIDDPNYIYNAVIRLIAKIPTMIAAFQLIRKGQDPIQPRDDLTYSSNFLYMLTEKEQDPIAAKVFDRCLILHAEHSLNASTFSARVTASTLTDPYAVIASAVGTLAGPLHGGANEDVIAMLEEIKTPENAASFLDNAIKNKSKIIKNGDLVKIDTGAYLDGFHGDSCISICVGEVSAKAQNLSDVAYEALYAGLSKIKAGNTLLDVAGEIEDVVLKNGFSVVEDYTGHGVGRNLHEEPSVFNFRTKELPNVVLREGMTLAVEPIVNEGTKFCKTLNDRWTVITKDGKLSAQWEHTIVVLKDGIEILTDRDF